MHDKLLSVLGISVKAHGMMVPVLIYSHWHGVSARSNHALMGENRLC